RCSDDGIDEWTARGAVPSERTARGADWMKWLASTNWRDNPVAHALVLNGTRRGGQPWTMLRSIWGEGNRKFVCDARTVPSSNSVGCPRRGCPRTWRGGR